MSQVRVAILYKITKPCIESLINDYQSKGFALVKTHILYSQGVQQEERLLMFFKEIRS